MKNILFLGHFPGPKVSPHGKTIYYKVENYKFTVDKPERQHFDQVIKFSIIDIGANKLFLPPVKPQKGCSIIFVIYLPRMQTLNLTMGEQSDRFT